MEHAIEKKYIPLANYFHVLKEPVIQLSFSEIETIIGQKLPNAAYLNRSWWTKTKPPLHHFLAWTEKNYFVSKVQLGFYVQFERSAQQVQQNKTTNDATCTYIIRQAELNDVRNLTRFMHRLKEVEPMNHYDFLQAPDTLSALRKRISHWNVKNAGQFFVAVVDGHIRGVAQVWQHISQGFQHRAMTSLQLMPEYQKAEIAHDLLCAAEEWAKKQGIERLDASVLDGNHHTLTYYKSRQFEVEGTRLHAIHVNGQFYDEVFLGKMLTQPPTHTETTKEEVYA